MRPSKANLILALRHAFQDIEIFGVEPEGYDDTTRSLESGNLEDAPQMPETICDALRSPKPGALTFAINRRLLAGGLVVGDADVRAGMARLFGDMKLVAEPAGAIAFAAVSQGLFEIGEKTVVVVCSGGNVDAAAFADALVEAS